MRFIKLSDLPDYTKEEIIERINRRKAEYRASLEALGATDAIKDVAKSMAKQKTPCNRCVYCDGTSPFCHIPFSDFTMEALDIDPCYDGVLRYLMRK